MSDGALMMFDFEEDAQRKAFKAATADSTSHNISDLAALMQPRTLAEAKLVIDVAAVLNQHGPLEASDVARALRGMGHWTLIRTALGGERGLRSFSHLRHTFIICMIPGGPSPQLFIVDPSFRDSFETASPTPRYAALLAALPPVFVGSPEYLAALVPLLCSEMEHSFIASGRTVPPWRQTSSMLARWHSSRIVDTAVTRTGQLMTVPPARKSEDVVLRSLSAPDDASSKACSFSWEATAAADMPERVAAQPSGVPRLGRRRSDLSSQLNSLRDFVNDARGDGLANVRPLVAAASR